MAHEPHHRRHHDPDDHPGEPGVIDERAEQPQPDPDEDFVPEPEPEPEPPPVEPPPMAADPPVDPGGVYRPIPTVVPNQQPERWDAPATHGDYAP